MADVGGYMAGGSKLAVYSAIGANSVVTVAKFAGFMLTGSGAMLSEGIHSAADVGNQTLLAVGMKRSERPADAEFPEGYGREAFIWALISAVGIFFLGCGVTVTHAIQSLTDAGHHAEPLTENAQYINLGILTFALVAEGASLGIAIWEMMKAAKGRNMGFVEHLRTTDDPFGLAVLLEDSAAVLGVIIAFVAIVLAHVTGDHYWDAIGSLAIGLLLGFVAIFLIAKNRSMLIGKAIRVEDQAMIDALLEADPAIERVVTQSGVVAGTHDYRIGAEIEFDGEYLANKVLEDHPIETLLERVDTEEGLRAVLAEFADHVAEEIGDQVDRIEQKIRDKLPKATGIAIEPD